MQSNVLPDREAGIVDSESGRADPWGLVRLDDRWFGPDFWWYSRLEDAMIASGWEGELPDGSEVAQQTTAPKDAPRRQLRISTLPVGRHR